MSATGSDRGTTLIEALAAVTITALLALIAFPKLQQSLAGFAGRETVAAAVARLRETRADAMRLGEPKLFEVGRDGRGFGATGWSYMAAPRGVSLGASNPITFYADGSSGGGAVFISDGRRRTRLDVAAATGAISERPS
jgi:type II secretory pathway pseudopilin PulG